MTLLITSLVIVVVVTGCQFTAEKNTHSNEGTISISGAFALYPLTVLWAEEYMKLNPDVRIDISAGGAGKGMTDVLSGMVEIAMVSRDINAAELKKGAFSISVARDAVLPTISSHNPFLPLIKAKGLTKETLRKVFLSEEKLTWAEILGNTSIKKVLVYTRSDACGAAETWARYLETNQESLMGVGVFGDPGIANAVISDPYGIGYNNMIYVYDLGTGKKYEGIEIIPIDNDGNGKINASESVYDNLPVFLKGVKEGKYPSPPARDLYFVCKNKPDDPAVCAFLQWILSDGQAFVEKSGYVALAPEQVSHEMEKLK